MKPNGIVLGLVAQPDDEIPALVGLAVAILVAQAGEIGRVHDKNFAEMKFQTLNRIEFPGVDCRLVCGPVAVRVLQQSNLAATHDSFAQTGHVVVSDKERAGPGPERNDRWVLHQRIGGNQDGSKPVRQLQRGKTAWLGRRRGRFRGVRRNRDENEAEGGQPKLH